MESVEEVQNRVAARIVELRDAAGLTQGAVAEATGMSASNYQRIEYGGQNLTLETMTKIAHALGVGIEELFQKTSTRRKAKVGRPRKPE